MRAAEKFDRAWLATQLGVHLAADWPADQSWAWLIIHHESQMLIGDIGTFTPSRDAPDERTMQFSYRLVPAYQRQG